MAVTKHSRLIAIMALPLAVIGGLLLQANASYNSNQSITPSVSVPGFIPIELPSAKTLWVAEREVSVAEWQQCESAGACPKLSRFDAPSDHPMVGINASDAQQYIDWLRQQSGKAYRMPTQAEWLRFAAEQTPKVIPKLFTDPRMAWAADYDLTAKPVSRLTQTAGSFGHNAIGLQDIRGNVWEWTNSCEQEFADMPVEEFGCLGPRVAMGEHVATIAQQIRDPGNTGCGGGIPPANLGLRLVLDSD